MAIEAVQIVAKPVEKVLSPRTEKRMFNQYYQWLKSPRYNDRLMPDRLEEKKWLTKPGIGNTFEEEAVMIRALVWWLKGEETMPKCAPIMKQIPFNFRGEEIASQPLYRAMFLRGYSEIPAKGLRYKPRLSVMSWATEKGALAFVNGRDGMSNMIDIFDDGIVVMMKRKFNPADVIICPMLVMDKIRSPVGRKWLRGYISQQEVLLHSQELLIPKKDITVVKSLKKKYDAWKDDDHKVVIQRGIGILSNKE